MEGESQREESWLSLLGGAKRSGLYVPGYVEGKENFDKLLAVFSASTHSSFVVQHSSSTFSSSAANVIKSVTRANGIKWQQEAGELPVCFDGTLFVVCRRTISQSCLRGPGRKSREPTDEQQAESTSAPRKKMLLQRSRKGDCKAILKVLRVLKCPGFSIGDHDLSAKALRRKKEVTMDKLLTDLKDGSIPESAERFYVLLPTAEANNHLNTPLMGIAAGRLSQRIHPHLVERNNDFVSVGVCDAREMKKLLKLEVSAQTCLSLLSLS